MKAPSIIYKDLGNISYEEGLGIQTGYFDALLKAKQTNREMPNYLLFCEHNPVLTIGKSGKIANLLISKEQLEAKGVQLFEVGRGGDITYHGPGQITGYPILDLEQWKIGLKQYIYLLEEVVIRFLSLYQIRAERFPSATGVWLDAGDSRKARKICAIGVRSSRFVTMHGFALNICTDLTYFNLINPCGFIDKGVTSLEKELGYKPDMNLAKQQLSQQFLDIFYSRI
ncbi:MAG: lipoyl(octanoyl) transferase LipB [Tannerellaceae bacterium]|nr:lipoyl(octanoyl) transferase LipB [Tannerellaceae bacterium]